MNKKQIIYLAIAAVAAVGLALLFIKPSPAHETSMTMPTTSQAMASPANDHSVVIANYKFSPTPLKVKKGTTVTWTNTDVARHNIVADDGQPAGGPSGPLFGKGETYQFTFNTVGTYSYHCEPHPYMHGKIEVTE
ncbi:MAG: hypothetical protein NVSMB39_4660 [Candidatus Saccharimonadales bacterium]